MEYQRQYGDCYSEEFFGDAITVVSNVFFHKNIELKALWFVPLNDPMRLLMYSMVIGIIHMFLGLGIKGYMLLKDNKIVDVEAANGASNKGLLCVKGRSGCFDFVHSPDRIKYPLIKNS